MQHGRRMDGKPDPGCDPEGIVTIGNNAFAGNNFTEINIPSTVKEIGSYAFSTKNYLKDTICTITLPEGLETIGDYAFRNKIVETLDLPESVQACRQCVYQRVFRRYRGDGDHCICK